MGIAEKSIPKSETFFTYIRRLLIFLWEFLSFFTFSILHITNSFFWLISKLTKKLVEPHSQKWLEHNSGFKRLYFSCLWELISYISLHIFDCTKSSGWYVSMAKKLEEPNLNIFFFLIQASEDFWFCKTSAANLSFSPFFEFLIVVTVLTDFFFFFPFLVGKLPCLSKEVYKTL